ncbi:PAS domain S-box protein [Paracoccus gahaiensis]|uniref:histidine kinase n=1 Tax=Paracoccus gahaiensis TaxID=1706839 RepID=A0A4U0R9D4_9RHOB|nr:PAS domain S-box protein [Paracoccus gahaiensis]TJZ91446.1 PAS domain S-box protein [Paracoccus gahaiensis]
MTGHPDFADSVITGALDRRPSRKPDYKAETEALAALSDALSDGPAGVFQHLARTVLRLTGAGSAGIAFQDAGGTGLRWIAAAGLWAPHLDGVLPQPEPACIDLLKEAPVLLLSLPQRALPALPPDPAEALLAPVLVAGTAVGTLWALRHGESAGFQAEDARLLKSLARFASLARTMALALTSAEERRAVSDARLSVLARASSDVFYTMNADMSELRALQGGDFVPDTVIPSADWMRDYLPPEEHPRTLAAIRDAIDRKGIFQLEHRVRRIDGRIGWAQSRAVPILDARGEIVEWFGAASDVTARKQAEDGLRDSEARFRAFALASSDVIYRMSADWTQMDQLEGQAFLPDAPETGAGWLDRYLPPDDRAYVDAAIARAIETRSVFDLEHRVIRRDGSPGWARSRVVPVLSGDGRILEWLGAASDITATRQAAQAQAEAEAALRASEERQAFLFRLSDALRTVVDPAGIIRATSALLGRHLGVGRCGFGQLDEAGQMFTVQEEWTNGTMAGHVATCRVDDFGPAARALYIRGEPLIVVDTRDDPRLDEVRQAFDDLGGMRSGIAVPLIRDGRWIACFYVQQTAPRHWTDEDRALVLEVAERTWTAVEHARAQQAVRDSEARFRQLAEVSPDVIWVRNIRTGRIEYVSPAFVQVYGISPDGVPDEITLGAWTALVHPEDLDRTIANLDRVKAGEQVTHEFRIRHGRDGDLRWIRDTDFPLTDPQGVVQRIAGIGQDITVQKRSLAALREREERLALIVENARDYAIFTTDLEGGITDWWQGAEAVFGWTRAEVLGMDIRVLFADEDRDAGAPAAEMRRALDEGRASDSRWHPRRDGSRVFIEGALTRLGPREAATGFLKIGQDVTDRHRAADALQASEARLKTLVEGIPQLVWRACDKGNWTWVSPQWLDFTGQSPEDSLGGGWYDAVHPDDRDMARLAWDAAPARGWLDVEYRIRRVSDGAWIWHHSRSVPVRSDTGRIGEWLGTSTDVQALKELQERQDVLVAELQHRTRNLIAVIRSISDKTARGSDSVAEFRSRFHDRLSALARVQGLLSRLSDPDRVTFDELIGAELAAMCGECDRLTLRGPPGIRLRSSTVQTLAMALHELATNAVKYGALRQPEGRLEVLWLLEPSGEGGQPWLHIDWRETGVAMPAFGTPLPDHGQGRELIERALPYQLNARTSYDLGREGVHCTISLPVSASAGPGDAHA